MSLSDRITYWLIDVVNKVSFGLIRGHPLCAHCGATVPMDNFKSHMKEIHNLEYK